MMRSLQALNILAFLITILINYLSNMGFFNDTTIGAVSSGIRTLFTPAGYAFSIWGLIYLLLLGFVIYQSRGLFGGNANGELVRRTGFWFILSCLANSLWVICWVYGFTGLSVLCIFFLLFTLLQVVSRQRMELWDAPIPVIVFLWWPFAVYSGWVTVASVANTAAWLHKIGWDGWGLSETFWTLLMIGIATLINLWVTWSRNMREFALVGAWALVAIALSNRADHPQLYYMALAAAAVLLLSSAWHGWKNRGANPFIKIRRSLKH